MLAVPTLERCPVHQKPLETSIEDLGKPQQASVRCPQPGCGFLLVFDLEICPSQHCTQGCNWRSGPCHKRMQIITVFSDGTARVRCPHQCHALTIRAAHSARSTAGAGANAAQ